MILGATNRPFDLDDALLRRMPRKLLIDLPDKVGRAEILRLQLRGETLGNGVDIDQLASLTKDYSGSDLKSVCIAAALSAAREQIALEKDGKEVSKRVLSWDHFLKALKEIKASTSNETSTSVELRRWDDMFGEGKKKRKKHVGFS